MAECPNCRREINNNPSNYVTHLLEETVTLLAEVRDAVAEMTDEFQAFCRFVDDEDKLLSYAPAADAETEGGCLAETKDSRAGATCL